MQEEITTYFLNPVNYHPCRDFIVDKRVPEVSGIYAWCFKAEDLLGEAVAKRFSSVGSEGLILFYLGIAPDEETSDGNLRERLKKHMEGTARKSTLRYSLGALLVDILHLEVVPHGGRKLSFGATEGILSEWIREHGHLSWIMHENPWDAEKSLITVLHPPLNLQDNPFNPFKNLLELKRKRLRERAQAQVGE